MLRRPSQDNGRTPMQIVPEFGTTAARPQRAAAPPAGSDGGGFGALMARGGSGRSGPEPAAPVTAAQPEDRGSRPGEAASEEETGTDAAGGPTSEVSAMRGPPLALPAQGMTHLPSGDLDGAILAATEVSPGMTRRPAPLPAIAGADGIAVATGLGQPSGNGRSTVPALPVEAIPVDRQAGRTPDAGPAPTAAAVVTAASPSPWVQPRDAAAMTSASAGAPAGMEPASHRGALPGEAVSGAPPAPATTALTGVPEARGVVLAEHGSAPAPGAAVAASGRPVEAAARRLSAAAAVAEATSAAGGAVAAAAATQGPPPAAGPLSNQDASGLLFNPDMRGAEGPTGIGTAPGPSAGGAAPGQAAAPQPAGTTPAALAPQLAVAAWRLPDGPVELRLDPAELGRVTLTLVPAEAGLHVSVQAERSETLDLLRRSIGLLEQELRDLGYANTGFSFGEDRRPPDRSAAAQAPVGSDATPASGRGHDIARPTPPLPAIVANLDLRL
jgi:hypothetical protein